MNRRLLYLLPFLPFLLGAEVYRYVDRDGVVTYAERLPEGVQGERVMTQSGGPTQTVRNVDGSAVADSSASVPVTDAGAPGNEPANLSKDQQAMLQQLQKAEEARRQEVAKIRTANCEKSRSVLERLSANGRIRVEDESGQERAMPEDERQQRIREAQNGIVANCDAGA